MLARDLSAGVTVAALDVPQAMAYALIAGIRPEYGLYTAIVPAIIASILGSSSHLIAGPTNALSLLVFSAVGGIGAAGDLTRMQIVCVLTALVGVVQIMIALLRLGDLTRYVSEAVILGFLLGASVLIGLGQIPNLIGTHFVASESQNFLLQLWQTLRHGMSLNPYALALGVLTALVAVWLRNLSKRVRLTIPDKLAGLVLVSFIVWWGGWAGPGQADPLVEVIGAVPNRMPAFEVPPLGRGDVIRQLSYSPLAIALLGLVESLAIAKSIAVHTRQRLNFNRQCLAEGLANLGGSLFHCMPAAGSLTRSAINYQSGAVTRMAGVFSAVAVAVCIVLFAPLTAYVPKSALAAILIVTAWRLVDRRRLLFCLRATRYDAGIALATAVSAVFIGIDFSILMGVFLSFLLFVPRASRLRAAEMVMDRARGARERLPGDPYCSELVIYNFEGEMFFGAAPELDQHLGELTRRVEAGARVVVLRFRRVRNPDVVCLEHLRQFTMDMNARGVPVLVCAVRADFAQALYNVHCHDWLPPENIFLEQPTLGTSTAYALQRAYEILGDKRCPTCPQTQGIDLSGSRWDFVI
jgi:SulP family sulfate permease